MSTQEANEAKEEIRQLKAEVQKLKDDKMKLQHFYHAQTRKYLDCPFCVNGVATTTYISCFTCKDVIPKEDFRTGDVSVCKTCNLDFCKNCSVTYKCTIPSIPNNERKYWAVDGYIQCFKCNDSLPLSKYTCGHDGVFYK